MYYNGRIFLLNNFFKLKTKFIFEVARFDEKFTSKRGGVQKIYFVPPFFTSDIFIDVVVSLW